MLNKIDTPIAMSTGSSTLVGETPASSEMSGVVNIGDMGPPDLTPMQLSDYPVNFDDIPSVDSFFNSPQGVDWVSFHNSSAYFVVLTRVDYD